MRFHLPTSTKRLFSARGNGNWPMRTAEAAKLTDVLSRTGVSEGIKDRAIAMQRNAFRGFLSLTPRQLARPVRMGRGHDVYLLMTRVVVTRFVVLVSETDTP